MLYFTNIRNKFTITKDKVKGIWSKKIDNVDITLISDKEPSDFKFQENVIKKEVMPLLKSNLQKCIRRKEEEKAMRTALAMYSFKPFELFRRLTVIMIEDTLPHPKSFGILMWYLCATGKGYTLSKEQLGDVLGIISTMCENDYFVPFSTKLQRKDKKEYDIYFYHLLEIRKKYGGMWCDIKMMDYHQGLWFTEWDENRKLLEKQDSYDVEFDSIGFITKDDILLEAMDYHPYPFILKKMTEKFNVETLHVKYAIWSCRSRINRREPLDEYMKVDDHIQKVYELIKDNLDGLCIWLLRKIDLPR